MKSVRQNLSEITHQKGAGELAELKEILKPITFEAAIISSVDGFFGRKWLFEAVEQWLKTDNRLFWLKGAPGIGKSSFAAKLVHSGSSAIVGFFKCDFQALKSAEDSANECIRSLAYQLASRLPDYRINLLRGQPLRELALGIRHIQEQERKTPDDLFTYLITEPLNSSEKIPEASRLVLVIDALDEAGRVVDGKMLNPLADLLYKHADQLPRWLGVIVTSRPEAYLQQQLGAKFSPLIMEGGTQNNLLDIRDYLDTKLDPAVVGAQRANTIAAIIDRSGGTFLYIKRVERSYDITKPEKLPNGLDDLFYKDFERYFPDLKTYEEKTEKFLRLLAVAPGPLPKQLAQDLLQWQAREVTKYVTQPMASLLTETQEGLRFYHKSINDWLRNGTRSGAYQVNETGADQLGNFLWNELVKHRDRNDHNRISPWQKQILDWLPVLSISTDIEGIRFVIVDVETTGLSTKDSRICKIEAVKISNDSILYDEIFSEYVNPEININKNVEKMTGITNDMVKNAPTIKEVLPKLYAFAKGSILVGHHAAFSANFLEEAAISSGMNPINLPWLCTLKLSRRLFKGKSCSLHSICGYLQIGTEEPPNYAIIEAKCFLKIKSLYRNLTEPNLTHKL
jgi:DNA polymerase III epsilon subunit-like protein